MLLTGSILSGLATFEVAAKLGSFTQAANQLHLTTGAVSQQIRLLEAQLALALFTRHSRGIKLTDAGHKIFQVVQLGFSDIKTVIEVLQQSENQEGEIRLKLTPSFAFKWLVPRLPLFYRLYPNISIQTFAERALVDHQDNNFDLAIDYGQTPYVRQGAQLLLAEKLLPVMSPSYFEQFNWQDMSAANQQQLWHSATLLHDAMPWQQAEKNAEWHYWFTQMNIITDSNRGHFFNRTDMAMAAAEAGLGIAMARSALLGEEVKQGRLVTPFTPIAANAGYYLVQHRSSAAIECFKQWLYSTVANSN